jgi:glycosyltransferase involved in cell wall biosynthesis
MKVCIVIPTLNELQGLKGIVSKIRPEWFDRIVILDGGSVDGTIQYAKDAGYDVVVQKKPGVRMAYIECQEYLNEDIIITFSPDGNSIVETIPLLVDEIKRGYDMVIASRYKGNAKSYDDTFITGLANAAFSFLISLFGFRYADAMVMFRAYRSDVPNKLKLNIERSRLYEKFIGRYVSWEPLMSIRAAKAKLKISEIPSDEPLRIDEEHKSGILRTTRINHYRAGLACLSQLFEEAIFWKF